MTTPPEPAANPPFRIPVADLSSDALHGLLEEFVTRDGTELSEAELKIAQVRRLLERGEVEIWFDPATRSCDVLRRG